MSNKKFIEGKHYKLISKHGEESIAYFYKNPDATGDGLGFGYNIADGGGFLPRHDLTDSSIVQLLEFTVVTELAKT
jgi:hypothetical protein